MKLTAPITALEALTTHAAMTRHFALKVVRVPLEQINDWMQTRVVVEVSLPNNSTICRVYFNDNTWNTSAAYYYNALGRPKLEWTNMPLETNDYVVESSTDKHKPRIG